MIRFKSLRNKIIHIVILYALYFIICFAVFGLLDKCHLELWKFCVLYIFSNLAIFDYIDPNRYF